MKKFILLCVLAFGMIAAQVHKVSAQSALPTVNALVNPNGYALDTASQAAAEGPKTVVQRGLIKTVNIILVTVKISGTIAGTITWQGSNNGVDWADISTTALVDASKNYTYKEVDKGYPLYKALITQTGTSSLSYKATNYVTPVKN